MQTLPLFLYKPTFKNPNIMVLKHYSSNTGNLFLNVVTRSGKRVRVQFSPHGEGGILITSDPAIQDALERSSVNGKLYSLVKVEGTPDVAPALPVVETEPGSEPEVPEQIEPQNATSDIAHEEPKPKVSKKAKSGLEEVPVESIPAARDYLIAKGVSTDSLKNKKDIILQAQKIGIEFIIKGK